MGVQLYHSNPCALCGVHTQTHLPVLGCTPIGAAVFPNSHSALLVPVWVFTVCCHDMPHHHHHRAFPRAYLLSTHLLKHDNTILYKCMGKIRVYKRGFASSNAIMYAKHLLNSSTLYSISCCATNIALSSSAPMVSVDKEWCVKE